MRTIISLLVLTLCFGCKKCPPSSYDADPPVFYFSITDKEGTDIFFGENSIYDPYSVKNTDGQDEWIEVDEWAQCFKLRFSLGNTSVFYAKFVLDKTDTIKIESHFLRWYEEPAGCRQFGIYNNEVSFNNTRICTECDYQVYKIKPKGE